MEHSFVADGEIHESMATGHRPWFGTKRPLPDERDRPRNGSAGGIVASANDLARYLQMMMNGEDDVLSAEGKALMMRPASEASPFYGFGWFVDSGNGVFGTPERAPVSKRWRRWSRPRRRLSSCWSMAEVGSASGKRPSSATASPPGRLGLDYSGEGSRLPQKATLHLVGAPAGHLSAQHDLGLAAPWRDSRQVGPVRSVQPVVPAAHHSGAAWVILVLVPRACSAHRSAQFDLFQPDFGLAMIATAADRRAVGRVQARGGLHRRSRANEPDRADHHHSHLTANRPHVADGAASYQARTSGRASSATVATRR